MNAILNPEIEKEVNLQNKTFKKVTIKDIYEKRISRVQKINYFKSLLIQEANKPSPDKFAINYYTKQIWGLRRKRAVYSVMHDI